jgi:hypothetical protein
MPVNSVFAVVHRERDGLFPDEMFADLFAERGRRSVPPSVVATVMVLQRLEGLSDREAVKRYSFDARRRCAGVGGYDGDRFGASVLVKRRRGRPVGRWELRAACAAPPSTPSPVSTAPPPPAAPSSTRAKPPGPLRTAPNVVITLRTAGAKWLVDATRMARRPLKALPCPPKSSRRSPTTCTTPNCPAHQAAPGGSPRYRGLPARHLEATTRYRTASG